MSPAPPPVPLVVIIERRATTQAVLSDGKAQGFNGLLDMNNNEAFMAQFAGRALADRYRIFDLTKTIALETGMT